LGKRSRKRGASGGAGVSPSGTSRAERDEARRRRALAAQRAGARPGGASSGRPRRRGRPTIDERPPAPWGGFPLVEVAVLLAIGLFVAGLILGPRSERGQILLTGALALGSLAGLELSIREHFAGYRSHTTLIAAVCAFVAMVVTFFAAGKGDAARALILPVAGITFLAAFYWLREVFKRRSGGLGFR
jgi:hypothetical protein